MAWVWPVVSAVGGILGGAMSNKGASSANDANRKMALQQMLFQYNMSNTAHRREVVDLRKAGLNPILSATGGSGASTPSGSTAVMQNEQLPGVSTALQALDTISRAYLTREQASLTQASTAKTVAETATEQERPALTRNQSQLANANTNSAIATWDNILADTRLKKIGAQVSLSELDKNRELTSMFRSQGISAAQQAELYNVNTLQAVEVLKGLRNDGAINESTFGQILSYIDRALKTVNNVPLGRRRR